MKINHKITDTEQSVMEVLWERSEAVATRELLELMKEKGRNWKRQTLNTLLFRLEEKGIVSRTRAYAKATRCRPGRFWMISMVESSVISLPHLWEAQI